MQFRNAIPRFGRSTIRAGTRGFVVHDCDCGFIVRLAGSEDHIEALGNELIRLVKGEDNS